MSDVSKILDTSNNSTSATVNGQSMMTLAALPLGKSETGEVALKVIDAGSSAGTATQYSSTITNATTNGSIPQGVLGWSITALSGTVAVEGATVPVGASVSGGGYDGAVSSVTINYTITAGSALVAYDTPVVPP